MCICDTNMNLVMKHNFFNKAFMLSTFPLLPELHIKVLVLIEVLMIISNQNMILLPERIVMPLKRHANRKVANFTKKQRSMLLDIYHMKYAQGLRGLSSQNLPKSFKGQLGSLGVYWFHLSTLIYNILFTRCVLVLAICIL